MLSSPSRSATLHDVATHAGVAPMTVSRALNGGYVSDAKRELILRAVEELGYRPNLAARGMRHGKSRQIGVLVRNNSRVGFEEKNAHPLAYEMALGISEGLEEAGYMMCFVRVSDVDPEKHTQNSSFQGHLLDGLIVVSEVPAASVERLEELVPYCVWLDGNVWRDQGCVRRDEVHAGEMIAREIALLGYRKWIVLQHPAGDSATSQPHYSFTDRRSGLEAVAKEVGAQIQTFELSWVSPDFDSLWPQLQPDVAVIGLDLYATQELLGAASETGLRIGTDFALACCDPPFETAGFSWPQLARVHFSRFEMGRIAAQMMIRGLDKSEEPTPSRLVRGGWKAGTSARPCPQF